MIIFIIFILLNWLFKYKRSDNFLRLNGMKTKEMIFKFLGKNLLEPITINTKALEVVQKCKYLGSATRKTHVICQKTEYMLYK